MTVATKKPDEAIWIDLPEGLAVYPWLNEPDTKYNPTGDFKTGVSVPAAAAAATVRELERIRDEFYEALSPKDKKIYNKVDVVVIERDDAGEETGNILFNTKLHAVGENRVTGETWNQAPRLWDSEGNRVALTDSPIWSGSRIVCHVQVRPYAMASSKACGINLRLRDVQIVELVTGGGAKSPFAPKQGGYRRPASEPNNAAD